MDSHDWAHMRTLNNALDAELSVASDPASVAAGRIRDLDEALEPIFRSLPKIKGDRLNNGTARYALHRLFVSRHGWTMKGLQPAGGMWINTLDVTQDVRQVSKYIVPTLLYDILLRRLGIPGDGGIDRHNLAVIAATLEHIVRSEALSLLYSTYLMLGLTVAGRKTSKEVDDVLSFFLMVYAFGLNLEVSSVDDMWKAKRYLEAHHSGWPRLKELATAARVRAEAKTAPHRVSGGSGLDFLEVLAVIEDISSQYGKFHSQDCVRAKQRLAAAPELAGGQVPLKNLVPNSEKGFRPLFTETAATLRTLGAVAGSPEPKLVAPNYINSQSFCLSTASYYTVCCPNECEEIIASLERASTSDAMAPSRVLEVLKDDGVPGLSAELQKQLEELAAKTRGAVNLHSTEFSQWLHSAFPMECSLPSAATGDSNPRTPAEWMANPRTDVDATDEIMAEIATFLARYTTMGSETTDFSWPTTVEARDAVPAAGGSSAEEEAAAASSSATGASAAEEERMVLNFVSSFDGTAASGEQEGVVSIGGPFRSGTQAIEAEGQGESRGGGGAVHFMVTLLRPVFYALMVLSVLRFVYGLLKGAAVPLGHGNAKKGKAFDSFA
eukprot:TRINITY_DN30875_c0_g1_i1.p1 TRINITY_DN30875_c0_g1~~TRINITY_DN30875_c0_g1_i1.p1  ORF type:complete len:704 (-),score=165.52 TRINITY_DN30875_c0_g1_i1:54-1880(-)